MRRNRLAPTVLFPKTRRTAGPWPIRANFSQVSKATIGQVASDEPRPIWTARRLCLPGREGADADPPRLRDLAKVDYGNRGACRDCPKRARCTNDVRSVSRLENEAVLDRMAERLKKKAGDSPKPWVWRGEERVQSDVRRGFLCNPRLIVRRFLVEARKHSARRGGHQRRLPAAKRTIASWLVNHIEVMNSVSTSRR
jgi:hypothetical protein